MPNGTCITDNCDRPVKARKLCTTCYARWHRQSSPDERRPYPAGRSKKKGLPTEDRFWRLVDSSDPLGCWPWLGAIDVQSGYGRFSVKGATCHAHRLSYEFSVGALDPLLVIDHTCNNRRCVNPLHLEQVTHRVNIQRSYDRARKAS